MGTKEKLAQQKKAATQIAEIMFASLQQFSEAEQEARIRRIERVKIRPRRLKNLRNSELKGRPKLSS